MLRPFKIRPKEVRVGDETKQGYHVDQFEDAFARYLPPLYPKQAEHPEQPHRKAKPMFRMFRMFPDRSSATEPPERAGCASHPNGPVPACRYCQQLVATGASADTGAPDDEAGR